MGAPPPGRAGDLHDGRPADARVVSRRRRDAGLARPRCARSCACCTSPACRSSRAARAPGSRAARWPTRTRCSIALTRLNRILSVDPVRRRAMLQPGVVNARLSEAVAPHGLHYVPDPSSQAACTVGGNVAENAGGPHCLKYGVTTNHVVELEVVLPDADRRPARLAAGRAVGPRPRRALRRQRGDVRHRDRDHGAARADPGERAHACSPTSPPCAPRARRSPRSSRTGIVPAALEMMDRACVAGGRGVHLRRGLSHRRGGGAAGRARRRRRRGRGGGAPRSSRSCASAARARCGAPRRRPTARGSGRAGRRRSARWGGSRPTWRCRTRWFPAPPCRTSWTGSRRSAAVTGSRSATSSTPATATCTPTSASTAATRTSPDRVHVACREIMAACVAAGGSITGEHGVGSDKIDYMPLDLRRRDARRRCARCACAFDPAERANPGQGRPAARLPRVARDAGRRDERRRLRPPARAARHRRRRARRRRAARAPRPDSADALSLVCRLAHDEGWKIRVEGHGTWLAADAPADLAVSTRALDRVLSVSPADLVATVQAGTPIEALRRRLADEGMWLALDPPGRPERSLGSVVATATAGPLRHGFGPVRDHVLGCTVATGDGRLVRAGGRVVKNVAGYDLTKLQVGGFGGFGDHHRGAPPAPRPAARRRHADRPRPARHAHLRRARPGGRRSCCRRRSSCSPPRSRRSPTGSSPRASSAPTPRSRPTCAGSAPVGDLAWQPLPAGPDRRVLGPGRARQPRRPDHPPARRARRRHRRDDRPPGPRPGRGSGPRGRRRRHDPLDRRRAGRAAARPAARRRRARDPDDAGARPVAGAPRARATSAPTAKAWASSSAGCGTASIRASALSVALEGAE